MFKEIIISILIVAGIIGLDIKTQNFTKKSVEQIIEKLSFIQKEIEIENKENIDIQIKDLDKNWEEMHDKLAYYIEHDELEKVETAITVMKSYVKTEDFSSAQAQLEEGKFILEHIEEKNAFNIENIF